METHKRPVWAYLSCRARALLTSCHANPHPHYTSLTRTHCSGHRPLSLTRSVLDPKVQASTGPTTMQMEGASETSGMWCGWCMGIQSGNSVIQEVHVRWWYGILKEVVVKSKPPLRHRTSQVSAQFASTATQWATNGTGVWFDHRPISPTCIGGELDCDLKNLYLGQGQYYESTISN